MSYKKHCDKLQGTAKYVIYGLSAPSGKIIRYVGMTTNLYMRVMIHTSNARHIYKNKKEEWLAQLKQRPRIIILATCEDGTLAEVIEKSMISFYKSRHLLNTFK